MKNTPYEGYLGPRLPREVQIRRVRQVIQRELTPRQREVLLLHYRQGLCVTQIARQLGVNKSTVSRTLRRAEENLRRFLRY